MHLNCVLSGIKLLPVDLGLEELEVGFGDHLTVDDSNGSFSPDILGKLLGWGIVEPGAGIHLVQISVADPVLAKFRIRGSVPRTIADIQNY